MTFGFLKRKRFWKRLIISLVLVPVLLFTTVVIIAYYKQDTIVQDLIKTANKDFTGLIRIKGSHISPFSNFPYISIDLEELEVFEGKNPLKKERIVFVKDAYAGFNIFDLIAGKMDIKSVKISDGDIRIVQHKDGSLNIENAFKSKIPAETLEEEFHLDLQSIKLERIDISKLNEENNILIDAYVTSAQSKFKTNNAHLEIGIDTKFELSVVNDGDTTFIKHKHLSLETEIDLDQKTQILTISPTEIELEKATFEFFGDINLKNDLELDLHFKGNKPNFDLFLALAPEELAPTLKQFDNRGTIFFDASVIGKSIHGNQPAINAVFGCKNGYFSNTESLKKLDAIAFKGHFTNGSERNTSTMLFELENFTAKPEAGIFSGKIKVENFDSPEIDMNLKSDFDLDFLAKFLNVRELKGLSGRVALTMNFRDIIDIENPEKSIERFNESYFSELLVENLKFKSNEFHVAINDIDLKASLQGHEAKIEYMNIKAGRSDIQASGHISDLPAIIHHSSIPVETDLIIKSKFLDIHELTSGDPKTKGIDEQIENLSLSLKFLSSAKAITESPNLPQGEFFIEDLYAKMKHYPHTLHDFHADVLINDVDFKVVDFSGFIDESDFHFSGKLNNYDLWFDDKMFGDTKIEFDLTSSLLQFDNLFAYGGENFVPEDYRHEEIRELKLHGQTDLHFKDDLKSIDFYLTQFNGKMKVHPMKFEDFNGRIHLENEQLTVTKLHGKLGNTNFTANMDYYLGKGNKPKENLIRIDAPRLDFDQLMNYNERVSSGNTSTKPVDHDAVFSIYDFEFPSLHVQMNIGHLNYHNYLLDNFKADLKSETNHMLHVNKLAFDAAGGHFDISGYLSGKDKKHIYFKPDIKVRNVDLDKFMVKFDNFGQDHVVSENLHGKFSGKITGKIHLHADLVPKIDDSEIKIEMTVLKGKLENYAPILALSDYFQNRDLSKIYFDTLSNTFTLKNSILNIPQMTINSNLGFMEISGDQRIDGKMDMHYLIGVPWKMVGEVAAGKLFRKKKVEDPEVIQYRQENSRFVYVKMTGDLEDYTVSLSKKPK